MSFKNRIRLPFYLTRPQITDESNIFRLANGASKVQSIQLKKVYEVETDWMPENLHERFKIAISHENVNIEGRKYFGGVVKEGDYSVEWQQFLDFPLGKGSGKLSVTPYNYSNNNCQTCEEATQLELQDDNITTAYTSINEGSTNNVNVFANDSICCSPVIAAIVAINSTFVLSASINAATGILTFTLKPTTPDGFNVNLVTYRVTCPNGSYDDASVLANVSGSEVSCLTPADLDVDVISGTEVDAIWTAVSPTPSGGYDYFLYEAGNLGSPVHSGNTAAVTVSFVDLTPGTSYVFSVQANCGGGLMSDPIDIDFDTPVGAQSCGRYLVTYNNGSGIPGGSPHVFNYVACDGHTQPDFMVNMQERIICVLESSPGVPVSIIGVTSWEYIEPCQNNGRRIFVGLANSPGGACGDNRAVWINNTYTDIVEGLPVYKNGMLTMPYVGAFTYIKAQSGEIFIYDGDTASAGLTTGVFC